MEKTSRGYLKIILGSMFAGKTTELIKEYNRHSACGLNCCFINHSLDDRYESGTNKTKTHNKTEILNDFSVSKLKNIFDKTTQTSVEILLHEHFDVYFINEGQFFEDLYEWVNWLVNVKHKKVYVCGLDGDFKRKKFGSILDIIPLCDEVVKIKAICQQCKKFDGIFTHRLSGGTKQLLVGSTNYQSLCRYCYNNQLHVENLDNVAVAV